MKVAFICFHLIIFTHVSFLFENCQLSRIHWQICQEISVRKHYLTAAVRCSEEILHCNLCIMHNVTLLLFICQLSATLQKQRTSRSMQLILHLLQLKILPIEFIDYSFFTLHSNNLCKCLCNWKCFQGRNLLYRPCQLPCYIVGDFF